MIPNLWQYISMALVAVIFGMGVYTFKINAEVNSLTKDVADQEVFIQKQQTKQSELKTAINIQKKSEKENNKTIEMLAEEIESLMMYEKSNNKLHKNEIQKYKKIIESLTKNVDIVGDLKIKDCKIKIQEIKDEKDFIGDSISNIGS